MENRTQDMDRGGEKIMWWHRVPKAVLGVLWQGVWLREYYKAGYMTPKAAPKPNELSS
jgi:hypothetical protein